MTQISSKFSSAQESLKIVQEEVKQQENNNQQNLEKLTTLDLRYYRAKKVAAHIEKQMKEIKPNVKIDYQLIGDPEPSTQLLAAILAKDTPKKGASVVSSR